jgi:hypothetical protein
MAEPQSTLEREGRAFDMKAAAGAQLAHEPQVEAAVKPGAAQQVAQVQQVGEVALGIGQPVEIVGDREVLGDVAFPGRHRAAIGLAPAVHRVQRSR